VNGLRPAQSRIGQPRYGSAARSHAGTVWTNTWAAINDGFAEGGFKQSGIGRLRGPLAITESQEAKTVVHSIPPLQG
jgi:acyl-CoA reductase-like NAD-dependent aldehyde dehydrogenase